VCSRWLPPACNLARRVPYVVTPQARLQAYAFWELVIFLLNGLIFALIGLQLRSIVERLSETEYGAAQLVLYAVLISLAVILVRFLWVFSAAYSPRWENRSLRWPDPLPSPRTATVIAWSGMRGVISLAAALSLPLTVEGDAPFPERDLILFLTFAVILATLVVQGLSLPALIRSLEDDGTAEREEVRGRIEVAESALARLEELAKEEWVREDTAERVRALWLPPPPLRSAPGWRRERARGTLSRLPASNERVAPSAASDPHAPTQRGQDQ
jgi:hypothetical protein